jgi:hypothetical protein
VLRTAACLLLAVSFAAGCFGGKVSLTATDPPVQSVRFVALGDAGTGEADQARVARGIEQVCKARGCDFAVELGDNLYDSGASSARDPQFESKFEVPYRNLTFPFFVVLGNHDNSGDPLATGASAGQGTWYQSGNNEVAYGARTDRTSDKWTMPGRFYSFEAGDGTVAFFALDTNTLLFDDLPVPPDLQAKVRAQTDWIDGAVSASKAPWKISLGHHSYLSNGPHGNAGSFDGRSNAPGLSGDYVKGFYEDHLCGKVQLILAGHDHDLEWLQPVATCGNTETIVSGGGGAGLYDLTGKDPVFFQQKTLGFLWFEVQGNILRGVAFDADAHQLFERTLQRPF